MDPKIKTVLPLIIMTCFIMAITLFPSIHHTASQEFTQGNAVDRTCRLFGNVWGYGNFSIYVIGGNESLLPKIYNSKISVVCIRQLDSIPGDGIYVVARPLSNGELEVLKNVLLRGYPVISLDNNITAEIAKLLGNTSGFTAIYNGSNIVLFKLLTDHNTFDGRYPLFEKGYSGNEISCDVLNDAVKLLEGSIPS